MSVPIDIVVSDIGMSEENVYTFMRRVRALTVDRHREVPAIALTAYAREEDARNAHKAGYQKFLTKPAVMRALTKTIAELARAHHRGTRDPNAPR